MQPAMMIEQRGSKYVYTFYLPQIKNMLLYHPYTEPETACPEFRLNLLKMT